MMKISKVFLVLIASFVVGGNHSFEIKGLPVFVTRTISGEQLTHEVLSKGGVVTFFRSSCGYCLLEYPMWGEVRKQHPDLMMVLVIHKESAQHARYFLDQHSNPFNYVVDDSDSALWRLFGASQTPETFIIDAEAKIVGHLGYIGKGTKVFWSKLSQAELEGKPHT